MSKLVSDHGGRDQKSDQQAPYQLLSMETALLIATAAGREVNVSVWFNQSVNGGLMPVREFDKRLSSLASTMAIDQEEDIRRELELAVSPIALRMVHVICNAGEDSSGQSLIDLNYFFKISQEKVDKYLSEINQVEGIIAENPQNFRNWAEGEYDIASGKRISEKQPEDNADQYVDDFVEDEDFMKLSVAEYIEDSKQQGEGERPKSAPVGRRAASRGETTSEALTGPSTPKLTVNSKFDEAIVEARLTPSSPYDEAVEFREPDDDDHEEDLRYMMSRTKSTPTKAPAIQAVDASIDWDARNRKFLNAQTSDSSSKPRPSSSNPDQRGRSRTQEDGSSSLPMRSRSTDLTGRRSSSSQRRIAYLGSLGYPKRSSSETRSSSQPPPSRKLSPEQFEELKLLIEDQLRETVRKTDLYHLIQVNLGFIESYTMIPPRGVIVQSEPKTWLTNRDLQVAFMAARLCFNDEQLRAVRSLVVDFSRHYRQLYADKAESIIALHDGLIADTVIPGPPLGANQTLRSSWLQKYLVHLRLAKRLVRSSSGGGDVLHPAAARQSGEQKLQQQQQLNTSSIASSSLQPPVVGLQDVDDDKAPPLLEKTPLLWSEWLGRKLQRELERSPSKPRDFQRALLGEHHALSKDDVNVLLRQHSILPADVLAQEIEFRIEAWVRDTDGRRDFQHALNVKIRTWIWEELVKKPNAAVPKNEQGYWQLWEALPEAEKARVRDTLLHDLVSQKRLDLEASERLHREITRSLYWQFDTHRRDKGKIAWSTWLPVHLRSFRENLDKFREKEEARLKAAAKQKLKRKALAPLPVLEANLKELLRTTVALDAQRQHALQKALVSLRKVARTNQQWYQHQEHQRREASKQAHDDHSSDGEMDEAEGGLDAEGGDKEADLEKVLGDLEIVTKEEFDEHMRVVFAAYLPSETADVPKKASKKSRKSVGAVSDEDDNTKKKDRKAPANLTARGATSLTVPPASLREKFLAAWQEKIQSVFTPDLTLTVQRALDEQDRQRQANRKQYDVWLYEKKKRDLEIQQKQQAEAAQEARDKEFRQRKNEKAYKKWLRLRTQHRYKSMVRATVFT